MDEDLKIVLTSELEADEQASAQRISAQLPNIAKMIKLEKHLSRLAFLWIALTFSLKPKK